MAVKFSQFTQESVAADVTEIVGYSATGDLNVRIPPANLDTTYSLATAQDGSNVDLTLTGAKTGSSSTSEVLQFTAGSGVTLTAGTDEITIASGGVDGSGTANTITKWVDADTIGDSIMSETAAAGLFTDPYISVSGAGGGVSTQNLEINGFLLDSNGQKGTTGQILSSTGTLTDWITLPAGDTYTIGSSTNGSSVDVNLDAAAGADSNITLTPVGGITITQAADVITIDSTAVNGTVTSVGTTTTDIAALTLSGTVTTAGDLDLAKTGGTAGQYIDGAAGAWTTLPAGDTYSLQAGAKSGTSVPLNLDAATGSDSVVNLTEGTGITLTQTSATEITIAGSAGTTVIKDQFTGNNSTTVFTLSVTPTAAANLNIFISGVYQNSVDSGGTANYTVSGTTLTFVTPPPTTGTNGIEVVITQ